MRREALADFADTLMSYRRAQLHNWHETRTQGVDEDETAVSVELREVRARAWSALYRVQLLWEERDVVERAAKLVDAVGELKAIDDRQALGGTADGIRSQLSALMDAARGALLRPVQH